MATQHRSQQGDTVDLICQRHYGRTAIVTEAVYNANAGLCELGPYLPLGTLITLPSIELTTTPAQTRVSLWD